MGTRKLNVEDDDPLDWKDAAEAEALLLALAGGLDEAEAPAWIGRIEARLLAGVFSGPPPSELLRALADAEEETPGGRWLFARRLDADADAVPVIDAARAWAIDGGRAAFAIDFGVIEERSVFGPALEAAARVERDSDAPGIWVDAAVRDAVAEPARAEGEGYCLVGRAPAPKPRGKWSAFASGFAVAAAITLGLVLPDWRTTSNPLGAHIYVSGEARTRGGEGQYRANDVLHVMLEGAPGTHGTIFLLDSGDRLGLPSLRLVDAPFTEHTPRHRDHLSLDDEPGLERFVAVVAPAPLGASRVRRMVTRANEATGREARLAALRAQLTDAVGEGRFAFVEAQEIQHIK